MYNDAKTPDSPVRHKLQVYFDAHECQPAPEELAELSDDLDTLARQVGDFPRATLRVVIEWNGRNNEYSVKLTLILSTDTLVTSSHHAVLHTAFRQALDSLEQSAAGHKEMLEGLHQRQLQEEAAKSQPTIEPAPIDEAALHAATAASDYPAFRTAVAPYEEWLRLRVGRWVERGADAQSRMGRDFDVLDLTEGVFLSAFEQHPHWQPEVRYRDWLDGLIDPTVKAFTRDAVGEKENVNMARSACAAAK